MRLRLALGAAMLVAWAAPALAGERPLFDFRGEFPAPGGTLRLEARCDAGAEAVRCRVEGRGPWERGFRAEGQIELAPRAPAPPEPSAPTPRSEWF